MKKIVFAICLVLVLISIVGCSSFPKNLEVIYESDPPGGVLYKQTGEVWGKCPKTLYYKMDKQAREEGYLDLRGLEVRWPEGPLRKSGKKIRIAVDGSKRQVTFVQPAF